MVGAVSPPSAILVVLSPTATLKPACNLVILSPLVVVAVSIVLTLLATVFNCATLTASVSSVPAATLII